MKHDADLGHEGLVDDNDQQANCLTFGCSWGIDWHQVYTEQSRQKGLHAMQAHQLARTTLSSTIDFKLLKHDHHSQVNLHVVRLRIRKNHLRWSGYPSTNFGENAPGRLHQSV